MRIRTATADDAGWIARVHVAAWRETYPGIIPQDFLNALSVDDRKRLWEHLLSLPQDARITLVAEHDGVIVGFADGGPAGSKDLGTEAEVGAIYLLDLAKSKGVGRELFEMTLKELRARTYSSVGLWVASANSRAVRFYEAAGGVASVSRAEDVGGASVPHTAYVWR